MAIIWKRESTFFPFLPIPNTSTPKTKAQTDGAEGRQPCAKSPVPGGGGGRRLPVPTPPSPSAPQPGAREALAGSLSLHKDGLSDGYSQTAVCPRIKGSTWARTWVCSPFFSATEFFSKVQLKEAAGT